MVWTEPPRIPDLSRKWMSVTSPDSCSISPALEGSRSSACGSWGLAAVRSSCEILRFSSWNAQVTAAAWVWWKRPWKFNDHLKRFLFCCALLTFLSCLPGSGWKWAAASWHSWSRRWSSARRPCTGRPRAGAGSEPGSAGWALPPQGEDGEVLEEPKTRRLLFLSAAGLGWSWGENTVPHWTLNVGISVENSVHY